MELPDFLDFSLTTWLTAAATLSLLWLSIRRPDGLPPGPWIIFPLVGHLPLLGEDTREVLLKIGQKYGDVFHLYLGTKLTIVLNSYDVMKEALLKQGDIFSDRPKIASYEFFGDNEGIIFSSGEMWKEQRKFTLESLRELGLGKNVLEEKIIAEAASLVEAIGQEQSKNIDFKNLAGVAVCNVISNLTLGKRYSYTDPQIHRCVNAIRILGHQLETTGILNFIPALKHLPGDLFQKKGLLENREYIERSFILPCIDEHLANQEVHSSANDLIDLYIQAIKKRQAEGKTTTINDKQLVRVVFDLFTAGTETTTTALLWSMVYLLNHPDIQEKLHEEITSKIGQRPPRMSDKADLPYVEAFIMEVLRLASLVPLSLSHATSRDTTLRGYKIPKGTMVIPFLHAVMRDRNVWENPDVFNPERFLKDGRLMKMEQLVPFSLGLRVCSGENLSKIEIFLFIVSIVQRFQFASADGSPPSERDYHPGMIYAPKPFYINATRRQ